MNLGLRLDLREDVLSRLEGYRLVHTLGVEKKAEELALRFGENVEDAKTAAIFHDITKTLSPKEQLKLCEKYNIIVDRVEKSCPKILHGKTAAAIAREEYGISEHICDAISYHTTGRADMTLLEKITYIADYIEDSRSFDGVEIARKLAETNFDEAMIYALERTLMENVGRRLLIHSNTIDALNSLYEKI